MCLVPGKSCKKRLDRPEAKASTFHCWTIVFCFGGGLLLDVDISWITLWWWWWWWCHQAHAKIRGKQAQLAVSIYPCQRHNRPFPSSARTVVNYPAAAAAVAVSPVQHHQVYIYTTIYTNNIRVAANVFIYLFLLPSTHRMHGPVDIIVPSHANNAPVSHTDSLLWIDWLFHQIHLSTYFILLMQGGLLSCFFRATSWSYPSANFIVEFTTSRYDGQNFLDE